MSISPDDDPVVSKHVAINTTDKVVLRVFTLLIVRKQSGMPKLKIEKLVTTLKPLILDGGDL